MEIIINKNEKLKDIQQQFSEHYPFLKIEFYNTSHTEGEGSKPKTQLDSNLTIAEAQKNTKEGLLHIRSSIKVSELESDMAEQFGLQVQVFRKSGNVWLQTTKTDDWTLAEQNTAAEEMNKNVAADQPGDYQEQE
ncbi:MAG: hypothetical protein POELPBGB_00847 [Bacteroidia bacterium]|nr:hypothetical protein [Bacteroidia bacterium]